MSGRLDGRVAIVTGGAGGIGRTVCRRFVDRGAGVAVADLAADRAVEAALECGQDRATGIEIDVVDPDSACLLYTSPSPRDGLLSRMPSSA